MMVAERDSSPIGFNHKAFAPDGEVDEANLFQPDEVQALAPENLVTDDALNDSLDALLEERVVEANDEGDAVAEEQAEEPEELDALEALLQESLEPVRAKAELKELRARMARGGLSMRERQEIEAKVREWEARVEWDSQANVALFTRQTCACGTITSVFSGLLMRQRHRVQQNSMRWIMTAEVNPRLPKEVAHREMHVPMCYLCSLTDHGFPADFYPLIREG